MIATLPNPAPAESEELHQRLEVISGQIETARLRLQNVQKWHDHHALTARELRDRYDAIRTKVQSDVHDEETHGHHVTALEQSVRQWLQEIEL